MADADRRALAATAEAAVREAGAYLRERFRTGRAEAEYGEDDVKAAVDVDAEERIAAVLSERHPGHAVDGEEAVGSGGDGDVEWLVDPLDGTNNFAVGYPSIASAATARRDGTALATAIYEPLTDDCYVAVRGEGATLNGDSLSADARDRPLARSTVSLVRGLDAVRDDDLSAAAETVRANLRGRCKRVLETWSPCVDWGLLARGSLAGIVCVHPDRFEQVGGELLAREGGVRSVSADGYYVGAASAEALAAICEAVPAVDAP